VKKNSMSKFIDMVGFKNDYIEVVSYEGINKDKKALFKCNCICGNVFVTTGKSLRRGDTKSCGCMKLSILRNQYKNIITHGETGSRLYNIWRGIKKRCRLKSNIAYNKYYGSKGIGVCDDWFFSYENFREWSLNNGYKEGLTIDRIDNSKGYSPENCRWTDWETQQNNRRNNKYILFKGEKYTQSRLARKLGMSVQMLAYRLKHNIDLESPKQRWKD
jgi:conserved hypothetical protein